MDVGLMRTGTLAARPRRGRGARARAPDRLPRLARAARRAPAPSEAREREPALAPTVRLALEAPEDHSVDPRLLLAALRRACEAAGVRLREHAQVARIESDAQRHARHRRDDRRRAAHEFVAAERVLIAAGAWVEQIEGLPRARPRAGAAGQGSDPAPARSGRTGPVASGSVRFEGGYWSRAPTAATCSARRGGARLRARAPPRAPSTSCCATPTSCVPGVSELEIEELCVGLRPGTPDNAPAIGPGALEGLTWATGHHRNGILLAPLTAELVVGLLTGRPGRPAARRLRACSLRGRLRAPSRRRRCARQEGGPSHDQPQRGGLTRCARARPRRGAPAARHLTLDARGVAVAVDGEVVPRAAWESFVLPARRRVEVLTAMQGG